MPRSGAEDQRAFASHAAPFAAWQTNERHQRSIYERRRHGLAKIEAVTDLDTVFRARMRALAQRGGATTKSRAEPNYYRTIGRLGGEASVAARKRRIYAEIEGRVCEPVTVPPPAPLVQSPQSPPQTKKHLTLADILGEEEMLRQRGVLRS